MTPLGDCTGCGRPLRPDETLHLRQATFETEAGGTRSIVPSRPFCERCAVLVRMGLGTAMEEIRAAIDGMVEMLVRVGREREREERARQEREQREQQEERRPPDSREGDTEPGEGEARIETREGGSLGSESVDPGWQPIGTAAAAASQASAIGEAESPFTAEVRREGAARAEMERQLIALQERYVQELRRSAQELRRNERRRVETEIGRLNAQRLRRPEDIGFNVPPPQPGMPLTAPRERGALRQDWSPYFCSCADSVRCRHRWPMTIHPERIQAGDAVLWHPGRMQLYVLGVDGTTGRVAFAGYPPTIGRLSQCTLVEKGKGINLKEREYRNGRWGASWDDERERPT